MFGRLVMSWLFVTPWTAAYQASLSLTISRSLPKFLSIASVMPSSHLILWCPLLPSVFPSIRVFSKESAVCIRWPKYRSHISTHTHRYIDHSMIGKKTTNYVLHQILSSDRMVYHEPFLFFFFTPLKQCSSFQVTEQKKLICATLEKTSSVPHQAFIWYFSPFTKIPQNTLRTIIEQYHILLEKTTLFCEYCNRQSFQPSNYDSWIFILLILDLYPSGSFPNARVFIEFCWVGINQLDSSQNHSSCTDPEAWKF